MSWQKSKIGNLCTKITDGSHNPPKGIEHSDFVMLSSKNISDDLISYDSPRYLSESDFLQENKRTQISEGDVLLTIVGTVGRCAVVSKIHKPFTLQRSVAVLKPSKEVDSRFLMYSLRNMVKTLTDNARGVAQKGIYLKQIKELEIALPDISEQKRIAAILDKADAIRRKRQQAIQLADDFLRAVFLDMFGDPIINPNNWQPHKLGDLCEDLFLGLTSKVDYVEDGEGVPLIRAKDINTGELSFDEVRFISKKQHEKLTKNHLTKKGDLLVSKSGTLGTCAIVRTEREFSTYESIFTVRPRAEELNIYYLIHLLQNKGFKEKLIGNKVGGTVAHLNLKMFRDFEIGIPPIDLQRKFAEKILIIERKINKYRESMAYSDHLFSSVSQKAFAGEL